MQYFAMVSGAQFLPYVVLQKCKQTTATTGAGATYQAALKGEASKSLVEREVGQYGLWIISHSPFCLLIIAVRNLR